MDEEKTVKSCVFCGRSEGYICASCIEKVLSMNDDQLKRAHALAVEKGYEAKAEILSQLLEEEENVPKTGKVRPNMVRERPVRTFRPAYHEVRTQQAA